MTAGQDRDTAAGPAAGAAGQAPAERQTFRSSLAVVVWWIWVLFAAGNLIDLAVQGRDHLSVVAAFILLFITGVIYTTVQRPRIVADDEGLTIMNPLRDHRIGWAAVAVIDVPELLRVRCEWPLEGAGGTGHRVLYSWAVRSPRRKQVTAELRAQRRSRRGSAGGPFGVFSPPEGQAAAPPTSVADAALVVSSLTVRAEQARAMTPPKRAVPPLSSWQWPPIAAVVVPALALLVAVLA